MGRNTSVVISLLQLVVAQECGCFTTGAVAVAALLLSACEHAIVQSRMYTFTCICTPSNLLKMGQRAHTCTIAYVGS